MVVQGASVRATPCSQVARYPGAPDSAELSITAQSCVRVQLERGRLMGALWSAALTCLSDFGPQEIGNTAWAFSVFRVANAELLDALSTQFLATCATKRHNDVDCGGVEWVEIVNAIAVVRRSSNTVSTKSRVVSDLEAEFTRRFFDPVVNAIAMLGNPSEPHAAAYRALSTLVDQLGVAHLGPIYTRLALPVVACCKPPPLTWSADARDTIKECLAGRIGAGTTERCIVYAGAALIYRENVLEMPGQIYGALPRGPPQPIGETPEDRARALLRHVHRHVLRDNHAERAALLAFTTAALYTPHDCDDIRLLAEFTGTARMYASHVPCVSCVSALAQFSRFLPAVHLEFEFEDAWRGQPLGQSDEHAAPIVYERV